MDRVTRLYIDKAIRLWHFGLFVKAIERYSVAKEILQKAVEAYQSALENKDADLLQGLLDRGG